MSIFIIYLLMAFYLPIYQFLIRVFACIWGCVCSDEIIVFTPRYTGRKFFCFWFLYSYVPFILRLLARACSVSYLTQSRPALKDRGVNSGWGQSGFLPWLLRCISPMNQLGAASKMQIGIFNFYFKLFLNKLD